MRLPEEFINRMKTLLGEDEYNLFLESYRQPRYYGLRVNTLKVCVEDFLKISPFKLKPIPWTDDGFYYSEEESPGKHPYYYAGLYYIQEPSAMLPAKILNAQPGEYILDLCAAPGGKTVQIAAGMKGEGLLIANDINTGRVKALVKNIELCGIRNAIVTNETPEKLAINFTEFFDKILIDAPCSGEGMFRKDEEAVRSWEKYKCEKCSLMQRDILQNVDKMLKPGGRLVYSTCTFTPEENEKMISEFLNNHENYELIEIPKTSGIDEGRPDWSDGNTDLKKAARLWPHKLKGEGHFVALLRKKDTGLRASPLIRRDIKDVKLHPAVYDFQNECLTTRIEGHYEVKGNNVYCLPVPYPDLSGVKVAKFGWYLGEVLRDKFEPSHSFVISLQKENLKNAMDFGSDSREILSYLKGETVMLEGKKGLTGICVDGFTLGWAKQTGDMLKNLYPKGWRKMN